MANSLLPFPVVYVMRAHASEYTNPRRPNLISSDHFTLTHASGLNRGRDLVAHGCSASLGCRPAQNFRNWFYSSDYSPRWSQVNSSNAAARNQLAAAANAIPIL